MKTDDLIKALAADGRSRTLPVGTVWRGAIIMAVAIAAGTFLVSIGPRPDIADAAHTGRFLFKFVVTLALAASAWPAVVALSRPGKDVRHLASLLVAPALLAAAIAVELATVPQGLWEARMIGSNSMICLTFIPLIGSGPLVVFLAMLRYGAPTRPPLAGAAAGLLAGAVAATFYAAHCPDDSPLFVAVWYTLAIGGLVAVGALLAPRVARW